MTATEVGVVTLLSVRVTMLQHASRTALTSLESGRSGSQLLRAGILGIVLEARGIEVEVVVICRIH